MLVNALPCGLTTSVDPFPAYFGVTDFDRLTLVLRTLIPESWFDSSSQLSLTAFNIPVSWASGSAREMKQRTVNFRGTVVQSAALITTLHSGFTTSNRIRSEPRYINVLHICRHGELAINEHIVLITKQGSPYRRYALRCMRFTRSVQ